MSKTIFSQINNIKIIPVVAIDEPEKTKQLGEALCEGGLPVAEITFRTQSAAQAIKKMSKEFPNMLVGAGTVLTVNQVKEAWDSGAKFMVSPGLSTDTVEYCLKHNIPIIPGVATASEITQAIALGLTIVKFFPAELLGGVKMIKALSAPFSDIQFLPTGGISATNLLSYLECKNVIACGGSWMVKKELIQNGDFAKIKELTMTAVESIKGKLNKD